MESLKAVDDTLKKFHVNHEIFKTSGVIKTFNYPCQHSLKHYVASIHAYGSPNGLCSSMTENKHIKAVKKPWRCSSHYKAMKLMLLTNQHVDKLLVSHVHFKVNNMLEGDCLSYALAQLCEHCIHSERGSSVLTGHSQVNFKVHLMKMTMINRMET